MKHPFQNRRAYWGSLAAAASLVAILGYHVISGEHGYLALRRERQEYLTLKKQTNQLEQENDGLKRHIDALKHDRGIIEKRAREDFQMARPGEIILKYSPVAASEDPNGIKSPAPASPPPKNSPAAPPAPSSPDN